MLKVVIFLSLYGTNTKQICYIDNSHIYIQSTSPSYGKKGPFYYKIDLENEIMQFYDGKKITVDSLSSKGGWEAYPPISISPPTIQKIKFNKTDLDGAYFELLKYENDDILSEKFSLNKSIILSDEQIKALDLDYDYEDELYLIIEQYKYKKGVVFVHIKAEFSEDLNDEDVSTIAKMRNVFRK